jgi:tRNA threonylcarbamoyl adenosine modification protein (Sua5/YciO/YrdC/YwlC family)
LFITFSEKKNKVMLINIHPDNPDPRKIRQVADILHDGGVIIYPTDTVYSIGCDLMNQKAIGKVAALKGLKPQKADFSIVCYDLSHISEYARVNTPDYKLMKRSLPGPFTFILNATGNVPKIFGNKKKTIGIRVPDNLIARTIVNEFGNPIIATSVHDEDEIIEYTTDPELIHEKYHKLVDAVINGGMGNNEASTIVDCTETEPVIIRQGLGELD